MIDQALLTDLQYTLVEPPDGGASFPSGLWTREEVLASLNHRQDRLLKESLLLVSVAAPIVLGLGVKRVALPADWLRTVVVVWRSLDGRVRELVRVDSFEADHADSTWDTSSGSPLFYMEYDAATLEIQVGPAPDIDGTLDLLYIKQATELTGNGVSLTVPDELAHAVKYGSLSDLLGKDGRGQDLARSAYAQQRFQLGVEAARIILNGWS